MDAHDLVSAFKKLMKDKKAPPTKNEFLTNYPHYEAMLARMGGWIKLQELVGIKEKHEPKILLFDIEATNLKADIGFVLCIGYRWYGEKNVKLISIRDFQSFKRDVTCDKKIIEAFGKVMAEADMLVSWFGTLFDIPFLQGRCLINDAKPLPHVAHFDGWRTPRYGMRLSSNRLQNLSEIIPEAGKREEKTSIDKNHWRRAAAGYVKSIKYVEEHCVADIKVLDKVYRKIKPFSKDHPNMSKLHGGQRLYNNREACPSCQSDSTISRGWYPTQRGRKHRWSCQECGQWWNGNAEKKLK